MLPIEPGDYRLEFIEPNFSHDMEWYDDHAFDQLGSSDPVTATLGTATTGVDAALFLPTGAITGKVTDPGTGNPVVGAGVAVMSTTDHHPYAAELSQADGTYRITGLPPGDYWVIAATADGTRQPTFVGGTHTPQGATALTVTADHTTTGADLAPPLITDGVPTETLQGTLTDHVDAEPEPGVLVGALRAADFSFVVATFTDADGHYTLTVPAGGYYLEFFDLDHAHEFEWYRDQPHPTSPSDLTVVTAPGTADDDLIPLHGTAAGTVTDTDTDGPLDGIWVAVMSATDGHGVAGTTTDADGRYTIDGLDLGDYYVVFIDPTGHHAYEFHDDTPNMGDATPITITGSHTTGTDAGLTPAN
ncbi:MAG: carboxypeptidase regulatory-like domain-containing protein [Acidimicrobiales bacterium]|nr:carboxypeptidase regulatory-like domain-containing protein [Acidimicrobiales bacterium]